MSISLEAARDRFRALGLHATVRNDALFVAGEVEDAAPHISVMHDVAVLCKKGVGWTAIFHGQGQCTYEVPGQLDALSKLIASVYQDFHENGGPLHLAVKRVVPNCDSYLHGAGSPAQPEARIA